MGFFICVKEKTMNELKEFKSLLDRIYGSKIKASKDLGVSRQSINNWYTGKHKIPIIILKYLRKIS